MNGIFLQTVDSRQPPQRTTGVILLDVAKSSLAGHPEGTRELAGNAHWAPVETVGGRCVPLPLAGYRLGDLQLLH